MSTEKLPLTAEQRKNKREIERRWRKKHPEAYRAKRRRAYLLHREDRLASMSAYAKKNREKLNTLMRAWRKKNPDKTRAASMIRKARTRKVPIIEKDKIEAWLTRWHAKKRVFCYWCGRSRSPSNCHADHIVPISKGGRHCIENLVISCDECNLRKWSAMPEAWNQKLEQPVLFLS